MPEPPVSFSLEHPVVVEFPLRGEGWLAVTTPATRVPSHGVDVLGQTYAYDFVKVDERPGGHVSPAGGLRGNLVGVRARDCYAWGASIHAPCDGVVVRASDGMTEREWIHPVREVTRMTWNGLTFTPAKLGAIMGNHVLLKLDPGAFTAGATDAARDVFAGFAHLQPGSVRVAAGQRVRAGELLGRVGHTGNSTSPHLHFQVMDSADLLQAHGIACAFSAYEVERDGEWERVTDAIPASTDRIRSIPAR
ncbi:MAG: M23 family metallopeptidase [Leifsonia flava]